MKTLPFSNVIGFDDAPFNRDHRGHVKIVGAVFARLRFDGVLMGEVAKDGFDAAQRISDLVSQSKFGNHARLIMLQGITLAGFNVVDVHLLYQRLGLPVMVVSRRQPDLPAFRRALLRHIPNGREKWAVIERLGPPRAVKSVWVQQVGLTTTQCIDLVECFAVNSHIPEPIRVAHLIAGALVNGESRGEV